MNHPCHLPQGVQPYPSNFIRGQPSQDTEQIRDWDEDPFPLPRLGELLFAFIFVASSMNPLGHQHPGKRVPRAWHLLPTFPCRDGASVQLQGETEAGDKQDVGEERRVDISGHSNDWNG